MLRLKTYKTKKLTGRIKIKAKQLIRVTRNTKNDEEKRKRNPLKTLTHLRKTLAVKKLNMNITNLTHLPIPLILPNLKITKSNNKTAKRKLRKRKRRKSL